MAVVDSSGGSEIGTGEVSASSRELDIDSGAAMEQENLRLAEGVSKKSQLRAAEIGGAVMRPHREDSSGFDIKGFQTQKQWGRRGVVAQLANGGQRRNGEDGFQRDMMDLQELLSKLNPMAEEFVPQSQANHGSMVFGGVGIGSGLYSNSFMLPGFYQNAGHTNGNVNSSKQRKTGHNQGRRRMNSRTSMAQHEEIIRRTVYVSDIDQQVTEEELAALFVNCGQVVDCRVCGDPNSILRFAFVEFTDEEGANASLSLSGTMLGYYPVRVLPSKTAIAPVDPKYLPRSEDEREMCTRTIYCTNIDNKVNQSELKLFFERVCGPVFRLRVLGDYHHATRIAFIEFARAESAIAALNCSGAILGSLPLRVSPSKTPVRPRATRVPMS